MSHPLPTFWTFYLCETPKTKTETQAWEKCIKVISTINTVEEFWGLYTHLERPSKILPNYQYHVFRNKYRAVWEDEENKNGGVFSIPILSSYDECWEKILLILIGDSLSDDINGVVLKGGKIDIWHRTASNENLRLQIASQIFSIIGLAPMSLINYRKISNPKLLIKYQFNEDGAVKLTEE